MDVARSCRCCLRRAPHRELTAPYTHRGSTEIYSDMLKQCFDIHLILESDDKVGICEVCVGRLRDASDFKLQVQHCQLELRVWLQGARQIKEEEPAVESLLEDGDVSSEEPELCEEPPVKQETEDENGTSDGERQVLSQYGPAVGAEKVREDGAGDKTLDERAVQAEVSGVDSSDEDCISLVWPGAEELVPEAARAVSSRARHQLAMACSVRLERLRERARQTCLATSRRGPRLASRGTDMPGDTAGARAHQQYTCDTCGERFTGKSSLIAHIQGHGPKKPSSKKTRRIEQKCDICNKMLARHSLKNHKRLHTGEKPYACGFCDKRFAQLSTLNAHTPQHTGEKRFSCNICHKRFTRLYTLRKHEKTHHTTGDEVRPFECKECHIKFKLLYYLKAHARSHLKVKPYGCDICNKGFTRQFHLSVHMESHTGKRRFSCEVCNRQFSYHNDLKKHSVMYHTGEKPYACDICEKRFPLKNYLTSHMIRHAGTFSCKECSIAFSNKRDLDRHLTNQSHTAKKRYICDICNKPYSWKNSLITHIKLHMTQELLGHS